MVLAQNLPTALAHTALTNVEPHVAAVALREEDRLLEDRHEEKGVVRVSVSDRAHPSSIDAGRQQQRDRMGRIGQDNYSASRITIVTSRRKRERPPGMPLSVRAVPHKR
jgi:hypothetical protein